MTKEEAAGILELLLKGIHPSTGEMLPDDHVCAETSVIRALHMGYAALMHGQKIDDQPRLREDFVPASRENTHNPWTDEEDRYICKAWEERVPLEDVRRKLCRTLRSVKCRLVFLGVADPMILERKYQPPSGCEHSGLPWYPEEEEAVRALYAAGIRPVDIARQLKRTFRAVLMHMVHMALISQEDAQNLLTGQEGNMPS